MALRLSLNFARWGALILLLIIGLSMFNVKGQNNTNSTSGTNSTTNSTTNTTNSTTNTTNSTTNSTSGTNTTNTTTGANTTNTGGSSTLAFVTIKTNATNLTVNGTYTSYIIKAGTTSYFCTDVPTTASGTVPIKITVFPAQATGVSAFSSLVSTAAYQDRATATAGSTTSSIAMTLESSTTGQTTYTASAIDGYYMLSLKNQGSTDQMITVRTPQTRNYFISGYSTVQAYHASTDPALRTFELYINNTQGSNANSFKTYFELDSCVGESLIYFSTADPSTFPTNSTLRLASNVQLKRAENNLPTGTYYLYVQPVEFPYTAGGVNYATYQINTETIFANETLPQTYYRPGNNAQVYFKINDGSGAQLSVNWTPFAILTTAYSFANTLSTGYNVIASPSKAKVTSIVNCGSIVLPSTAAAADANLTSQDVQASSTTGSAILNLQSNTAYYVGVFGTISGFSASSIAPVPQSMPYGVFYYQAPPAGSSGSSTDGAVAALIAIDVILFVVCIILGAIIYKMFYSKSAAEASGSQFAAQGGNSASASSSKNKYRV